MARFHYPRKLTAEEKARLETNPFGPVPEGSNIEFCREVFDKLEVCESKYIDREKTYCLFQVSFILVAYSTFFPLTVSDTDDQTVVNFLATLPEYHRKGLGKQLIDVCLKDASEARAETFLIATPTGSGLYRKLGFEAIDRITWDTVPHGGDGVVTWLCMTKQPNHWGVDGSITNS